LRRGVVRCRRPRRMTWGGFAVRRVRIRDGIVTGPAVQDEAPEWLVSYVQRVVAHESEDHLARAGYTVVSGGPDSPDGTDSIFYHVVLHGRFAHWKYTGPVGSTTPRGSVVAMAISARLRGWVSYSIGDRPPEWLSSGPFKPLPLRASRTGRTGGPR
jgi:hypothetical protein